MSNPLILRTGDGEPMSKAQQKRVLQRAALAAAPIVTPAPAAPLQIRVMYSANTKPPRVVLHFNQAVDQLVFDLDGLRGFLAMVDKAGEDCLAEWMKITPCAQCGQTLDKHSVEITPGPDGEHRVPICPPAVAPSPVVAPGA